MIPAMNIVAWSRTAPWLALSNVMLKNK